MTTPHCEKTHDVSSSNLLRRRSRQSHGVKPDRDLIASLTLSALMEKSRFRRRACSPYSRSRTERCKEYQEAHPPMLSPSGGQRIDFEIHTRIGDQSARLLASEIALYHPSCWDQSPTSATPYPKLANITRLRKLALRTCSILAPYMALNMRWRQQRAELPLGVRVA
jgi:hypothetical protein